MSLAQAQERQPPIGHADLALSATAAGARGHRMAAMFLPFRPFPGVWYRINSFPGGLVTAYRGEGRSADSM